MLFQTNPEWFTRSERMYLRLIPALARLASVVFTSSGSERSRIIRNNPSLHRVEATGLGTPTALEATPDADPSLEPGQFLLTVGRLNVRKNLSRTIDAALVSGRISPAMPLVIVGSRDGRSDSLSEHAEAAIRDGAVRFSGAVEDARLAWLYRETRLMLFLSLDEGYGLPPIEALAAGAPVIASDRAVFRELLGEMVQYCDPADVTQVSQAIEQELDREWSRSPRTAPGNRSWADVVQVMRDSLSTEGA